ncbi:MAG: hypothetical protein F6K54_37030 [Okeania sp. SIO3B5]|uniref:hypothetical protein n=1 Tax=Okeania sp. SIO3B5 TaxID=2607811 RepID=UPI0013FF34E5|nr:hypothetical protein [Okeania sp. SIO3B5]NEO58171.1 hypothetical protein [Okeania sp. SIO3B5]
MISIITIDISRKEGTGNREQGRIIDNFWVIIDFIFDFWRYLILNNQAIATL